MLLLLILSVISVTVMILRGTAIRRKAVLPTAISAEIERLQPAIAWSRCKS